MTEAPNTTTDQSVIAADPENAPPVPALVTTEPTGSPEHDSLLKNLEETFTGLWHNLLGQLPWHAAQGQAENTLRGLQTAYDSSVAAVKADAESAITSAAKAVEADAPAVEHAVEEAAAPVVQAVETAAEHL